MGPKLSALYYLSGTSNELDRKGISKDAPNGRNSEGFLIPKVSTKEILSYGEAIHDKMC